MPGFDLQCLLAVMVGRGCSNEVHLLAVVVITLFEVEPAGVRRGLSPALSKSVQSPDCKPPSVRSNLLPQDVLLFPAQCVLEADAVPSDDLSGLVEPVKELTSPDGIGQVPPRLFGRGRGRFLG